MEFFKIIFQEPVWFCVFVIAYAPAWGSTLACALDRCIHQESHFGRSHCRSCNRQLPIKEMIPIVSYLTLRGRCAGCGKKIGPTTFVFETISLFCFSALAFKFGPSLQFLGSSLVASVLLLLSARDIETWSLSIFELCALFCSCLAFVILADFDIICQFVYASCPTFVVLVISFSYKVLRQRSGFGKRIWSSFFVLA